MLFNHSSSVNSSLIHPQPIKPPPVAFIPFLSNSLSSPHLFSVKDFESGTISVGNVHTNVFVEMGRPLYSFSFSVFTTENGKRKMVGTHKIVKTFEELEQIHAKIIDLTSPLLHDTLPEFPYTNWLSFSIRLDVLKQRQNFLKEYFVNLLSCKTFLCSLSCLSVLNIPSELCKYLSKLGMQEKEFE